MELHKKILLILGGLGLFTGAFLNKAHCNIETKAVDETAYFSEDFEDGSMDENFLTFYSRGGTGGVTFNDGKCNAEVLNNSFATVNTYSNYVLKFRICSDVTRFVIALGVTDTTIGYNGGAHTSSTCYSLAFKETYAPLFHDGGDEGASIACYYPNGFTLSNSKYYDFTFVVTDSYLELSIDNNLIFNRALTTPLDKGAIVFSNYTQKTNLSFESISVSGLDYEFDNQFDDNISDLSFYNRSGTGSQVLDSTAGTFTFTAGGNDNLATKGIYGDFYLKAKVKNTNHERINFSIGGETSPSTVGYGLYGNVVPGMVRVNMINSTIRYTVGVSGKYDSVNISNALSKTNYVLVKISMQNYHLEVFINEKMVLDLTLNSSTYTPGHIIFAKTDAADPAVTSYEFDYLKVTHNRPFSTISTQVLGITEADPTAENSLFKINLSTSDYSGKSKIDITTSNTSYIESLNTKDYIRINGVSLAEDSVFLSGKKYINYEPGDASYAFVKSGNQEGIHYGNDNAERGYVDSDGIFVPSADACAYEIEIKQGCEFPSYSSSLSYENDDICYVADQDYVFVWRDNAFVLESEAHEQEFEDIRIMGLTYTDNGGANKAINLEFDHFDWPLANVISNHDVSNTQSCLNLNSRISIFATVDDVSFEISTGERFINAWGQGTSKATLSLRVSSNFDPSLVDAIFIHHGAQFPSYYNETHQTEIAAGTAREKYYTLAATTRFYSDFAGNFYKATDNTIAEFAENFANDLKTVCELNTTDGDSLTKTKLATILDTYYKIYSWWMPVASRNELAASTDSIAIELYERFNYIMSKYDYSGERFNGFLINSASSAPQSNRLALGLNNDFASSGIIIVVSVLALGGLTGIFLIKRRREIK